EPRGPRASVRTRHAFGPVRLRDQAHAWAAQQLSWNRGAIDGFVLADRIGNANGPATAARAQCRKPRAPTLPAVQKLPRQERGSRPGVGREWVRRAEFGAAQPASPARAG